MRPLAAKTSAQQVRQKASSVTWSYFRTNSSRTRLHCCGRSVSPARSQASISVQQTSANVSRLAARRSLRPPSPRRDERDPRPPVRARPRRIRVARAREARGRCRPRERDLESRARELRRRPAVAGALRPREVEPPLLGAGGDVPQQPLRAGEPTARRRVVPERECVLPRQPERDAGGPSQLAVATEPGVRPLAMDDGVALLPQPPERSTEPVERLGRIGDRQRAANASRAPAQLPVASAS